MSSLQVRSPSRREARAQLVENWRARLVTSCQPTRLASRMAWRDSTAVARRRWLLFASEHGDVDVVGGVGLHQLGALSLGKFVAVRQQLSCGSGVLALGSGLDGPGIATNSARDAMERRHSVLTRGAVLRTSIVVSANRRRLDEGGASTIECAPPLRAAVAITALHVLEKTALRERGLQEPGSRASGNRS